VFTSTTSTHIAGSKTTIHKTYSPKTGGGFYLSIESVSTVTFDIELSDTYTASQLYDDANAALVEWVLSNVVKLPFREDGWLMIGVLCRYNEKNTEVSPDMIFTDCGWVDPATTADDPPTGDLLGIPFAPGYADKSFGYYHETWKC